MLRALLFVLSSLSAFAAEEAVPTHLKVKASFTRLDKDGKPEVYAEPTVITVDGKQTTIRVGSADEGVVFTVTPKVNKDGTLTLDADLESREAPPAATSAPAATPAAPAPAPRAKSNLPFFHGVLTKDNDGWTLKSYDEKREALTLSRLGQSVELVLHKAVILDAPAPQVAVYRSNTTIMVKPGEKTLIGGGNGRTISLEAEILDVSK
ncbi:MAG: hypothetical protein EBV31_04385 [Verrucomicrobia bacterium]|nr:hypothetical protein [Verrucomicrobiota bacterium]